MGSRACVLCSCGVQGPECMGSVVCGMWTLLLRRTSSVVVACGLSCPAACGILVPQPGIEPMSPALEDGFFTTGPPGKSLPVRRYFLHLFMRKGRTQPVLRPSSLQTHHEKLTQCHRPSPMCGPVVLKVSSLDQ